MMKQAGRFASGIMTRACCELYLPTCTTEELTTVFGPVTSYIVEDAGPDALLRFQMQSGALKQKQISIGRVLR